MSYANYRVFSGVVLAGSLSLALASSPAIGLIATHGSFQVDRAPARGNATIFDGNTVETGATFSDIKLYNGSQLQLAADSRAQVFENRMVLEKGAGQLQSPSGYSIEARSLRVSSATPRTLARVQMEGSTRLLVAALRGAVRVTNNSGVLVAELAEGKTITLEPQGDGASSPTKVSGCLLKKSDRLIIVDQTASVTMELDGEGLEKALGSRVEITGAAQSTPVTVAGASQVLKVLSWKQVSKGGCASVAKKAGAAGAAGAAAGAAAGTAAGAAAGAGLSTAATAAIIGGVAVGATTGGLAAAGKLPGQGHEGNEGHEPPEDHGPPASR